MEANFFRFLAGEMATLLATMRVEKVHGPAEGVTVLTLHGPGRKLQLLFRPAKSAGLLFVSDKRPANPFTAPARVMWLRKRLTGRRLLEPRMDWPNLRLGFALSPRDIPQAGNWLVFDLLSELTLAEDFPPAQQPAWPPLSRILDDAEVWREHPQATPPLRKHLCALAKADPLQAQRLLGRLAAGLCDGYFTHGDAPPLVWSEAPPDSTESSLPSQATRHESALEAARAHGERVLFSQLARSEEAEAKDHAAQARKRLKRQLVLLDKDEKRHTALAALALPAEALQISLSGLRHAQGQSSVVLEHPEHGPLEIPLDPRLNPVENMARLFQQAARGRRGLEHVTRRRELLLAGQGPELLPAREQRKDLAAPTKAEAPLLLPKRYQGLAVASFRTSDGFLVLRGKSSQANHDLLSKAAGPHDYWLHAAGGPSAHVILRRDYPDQPVPEQSLLEAAGLCALKSWRKDDAKAEVMLARVKDVRKVKGAAIGSVAVDEVERMLLVGLDPSLEERLAVFGGAAQASPGTQSARKQSTKKQPAGKKTARRH
ncbi:NFACT RNA binding domain-containing protein [Humidesulfovibrio sp.]